MKLKHLYEEYELKKSDIRPQSIVTILFENDDCQIIQLPNKKNKNKKFMIAGYSEYPTSNVQELQLLVNNINNTSNQINKHEKLVELLNSSLVNDDCDQIAKLLSTSYFGYSDWHIPSFENLRKIKDPSLFTCRICLDKIILEYGFIYLTNFTDGEKERLITDSRLILIRYK